MDHGPRARRARGGGAGRAWRAAGWLPALAMAAAGLILWGMALLVLFGLAGLVSGMSPSEPVARSTPPPVFLVLPRSPGSDVAVTVADDALEALVEQPLPALGQPADEGGRPAAVVAGAPSAPEPARPTARPQEEAVVTYGRLFQEIGAAAGVDWRLLAALAYRESRLDPLAVGADGDMGLTQILPATWAEFAPAVAAQDPFHPRDNVEVAAAYLRYLQVYLQGLGHGDLHWVLVAYNWGPDNVRRLLMDGGDWYQVPSRQQSYVNDILQAAFGTPQE